jgi:hypothetical protein
VITGEMLSGCRYWRSASVYMRAKVVEKYSELCCKWRLLPKLQIVPVVTPPLDTCLLYGIDQAAVLLPDVYEVT